MARVCEMQRVECEKRVQEMETQHAHEIQRMQQHHSIEMDQQQQQHQQQLTSQLQAQGESYENTRAELQRVIAHMRHDAVQHGDEMRVLQGEMESVSHDKAQLKRRYKRMYVQHEEEMARWQQQMAAVKEEMRHVREDAMTAQDVMGQEAVRYDALKQQHATLTAQHATLITTCDEHERALVVAHDGLQQAHLSIASREEETRTVTASMQSVIQQLHIQTQLTVSQNETMRRANETVSHHVSRMVRMEQTHAQEKQAWMRRVDQLASPTQLLIHAREEAAACRLEMVHAQQHARDAQDEMKRLQLDTRMCAICLERARGVVYAACGHVTCQPCYEQLLSRACDARDMSSLPPVAHAPSAAHANLNHKGIPVTCPSCTQVSTQHIKLFL